MYLQQLIRTKLVSRKAVNIFEYCTRREGYENVVISEETACDREVGRRHIVLWTAHMTCRRSASHVPGCRDIPRHRRASGPRGVWVVH